jgi:hypothetical protein
MAQGLKTPVKQLYFNNNINFEGAGYKITNLADGINPGDAVNLSQLQSVAAGFNVHEPVNLASTANVNILTLGAGDSIDGVTLVIGDRILLRAQNTLTENGIYEVTSAGIIRPADSDGTPVGEIAAGDIVHTLYGNTYAGFTFTLLKDGNDTNLVPGVNDMVWTVFSSLGTTYTASVGTTLNANNIELDFSNLTATAIDTADTVAFYDASITSMKKITVTNLLANLDIVNGITSDGFPVRTAEDTYASRSFAISANNDELGLTVANASGVSGNVTYGISIVGLTTLGVADQANDYLMIYDASTTTNKKISISELGFGNYVNSITTDSGLIDTSAHAISILGTDGTNVTHTGTTITVALDLKANGGLVYETGQLAVDLGASAITGFLDETNGGTGQTSYAVGDILYASGINTLSKLGIGATGDHLEVVGGVPQWRAPQVGDITEVIAGTGLTGGGTTGAVTVNVAEGAGIYAAADAIFVRLDNAGTGATGNGLKRTLGTGTNQLGIFIDDTSDTTNLVSAIAISSDALKVGIDNSTIKMDGTGYLYVNSITASVVSDFTAAAETAIFTSANFVDSATIDFTVTAGDSVTAIVKANSITDSQLLTTNTGVAGQLLSLGNSAGEFTYVDPTPIVQKVELYQTAEVATDVNGLNGAPVTYAKIIDNPFGMNTPVANHRAEVYINGVRGYAGSTTSDALYFSTDDGATAEDAGNLANAFSLIFNATAAGFDIETSDNILFIHNITV